MLLFLNYQSNRRAEPGMRETGWAGQGTTEGRGPVLPLVIHAQRWLRSAGFKRSSACIYGFEVC